MKVVIDAREYTTTTGRYMFRLLQYLDTLDTTDDYVVLLKPKDMDVYTFKNPRFLKVACPYKEFTFAEQIGFKKQLDNLRPDLVHFGMVQQPILYSGTVITTMQDLTTIRFRNPSKNIVVFWIKQQVYKQVNKRAAHKSAAIITISEFVKKDIITYTGITADKITVTLEAADPIIDSPTPIATVLGKSFILYVGRPTPHKNLPRLIEAFVILQKTYPDLRLVLAGKKDPLYAQIEDIVKLREISGVVFTGFVSEGQLRWLYENCTAYVFPSLSEGFGLPGLEAMIHGAPVVSSNATSLPEVYGAAAQYFDPLDIDDMAFKISEVIGNDKLRNDLIKKGKQKVAQYSWQRMAKQTLQLYNKVLEEKRA